MCDSDSKTKHKTFYFQDKDALRVDALQKAVELRRVSLSVVMHAVIWGLRPGGNVTTETLVAEVPQTIAARRGLPTKPRVHVEFRRCITFNDEGWEIFDDLKNFLAIALEKQGITFRDPDLIVSAAVRTVLEHPLSKRKM